MAVVEPVVLAASVALVGQAVRVALALQQQRLALTAAAVETEERAVAVVLVEKVEKVEKVVMCFPLWSVPRV